MSIKQQNNAKEKLIDYILSLEIHAMLVQQSLQDGVTVRKSPPCSTNFEPESDPNDILNEIFLYKFDSRFKNTNYFCQ
jgi:hypothetical protein